MTRRSLLAVTAGALGSAVVRPHAALALLGGPPRPALWEQRLGRLPAAGAQIQLERRADLVGIEWQAPAQASVWVRFRLANGHFSQWASAGTHGHGPDAPSPAQPLVGDPVWTGGTTAIELRASHALGGVRVHLVDVSGGVGARRQATRSSLLGNAASLPIATPVLAAGAGQPQILARRGWAQGMAPPRVSPGYGAVRMAFVHHTENPNGYAPGEVPAMLRSIYAFHRFVRGWNDIGYNFVVDLYGRIFEARAGGIDEPVVGAQAGGYNLASTGVAVLGSFTGTPISPPARAALERLLAWKLSLHGLPAMGRVTIRVNPAGAAYSRFPANARVPLARIAGHRDGDSTDCPGNALYGELPAIRRRVRTLARRTARATLALLPAPAPTPVAPSAAPPAPGEARVLAGTLALLDGTPLAGAPVAVQARSVSARGTVVSERTIAEAATDAQGRWSLPVSVIPPVSVTPRHGGGVSLRALSTGSGASGACVSDPLHVAGTISLSPQPAPAPTPPAAAPPST